MEFYFNFVRLRLAIVYIIIFIVGTMLILHFFTAKIRKKFGNYYLRPNKLCLNEISNEKIVTQYIQVLLREKISPEVYNKINKKIMDDKWFSLEMVCKIGTDLQYVYKDDKTNIQVGKVITSILMEYRATELYGLTRKDIYVAKNWKKIIMEAEEQWNVTTSIDVSELPFIRPY